MPEPGDGFVDLVDADSLWDGEMEAFDVGADEVLLLRVDGEIHAYDGACPHQSISLVDGELAGGVLTCSAHEWQFDARTGESINPRGSRLTRHDVRIDESGVIQVRLCARARSGARPAPTEPAQAR
ncbi:(2Fe-2S)-binding protein [Frankia sp. CcI49]|uniref:Rieske 2Fe-2S domain-containing protein n=1 Tax=unclassified Frankia TaxID=2632575 RepID=UPI0006CA1999|nr:MULTISPECIES: Rieske 2Fe-2S domain-containing protein [unclassified Frankia]KPM55981.1 (2Fe-2S)-binding protein [Frankia sp. R43]ONH52528.1 (2Fe-2S)-binding protein [Frankia sp. CcI49]